MKRLQPDEGIGIITAVFVALIVFSLAFTWYRISIAEISQTSGDRARVRAVNAAEAGAREVMFLLASDDTIRDLIDSSGEYTTGITSGTCDLSAVTSGGRTLGEYWVRVTRTDPADLRYLIEAWGWAPRHDARQVDVKKLSFEIELRPYGGGFTYAMFAGNYGFTASNKKTIYGDIYSGDDFIISNSTTVLPNDAGWPGVGDVNVYANMEISGGSNNEFSGTVRVNGYLRDAKKFTDYKQDVVALDQDPTTGSLLLLNNSFNSPTILGSLVAPRTPDGTIKAGDGKGKVHDIVIPATNVDVVPDIGLPTFNWTPGAYDTAVDHGTDVAAFEAWWAADAAAMGTPGQVEAHRVSGDVTLDFRGVRFEGDIVIVVDGDVDTIGTPTALDPAADPSTVIVATVGSGNTLTLGSGFSMSEADNVHFLGYAEDRVAARNLTIVYGALYAQGDASGNQLEVHYRPLAERAVAGFTFDASLADKYMPQPRVWREIPVDSPVPLATYCTP